MQLLHCMPKRMRVRTNAFNYAVYFHLTVSRFQSEENGSSDFFSLYQRIISMWSFQHSQNGVLNERILMLYYNIWGIFSLKVWNIQLIKCGLGLVLGTF